MTDVRLGYLLATQFDIVAWWQLASLGWSAHRIDHHARKRSWQRIHNGVFACQHGPLTREQRWLAATLTEPGTLLAGHSAGACWRFRPWESSVESVVRHGSGGPRMLDGVYVRRSLTLADEIAWRGPVPITSAERTLIDLAPHMTAPQRGRATREAIRLRLITVPSLLAALDRHRGRRGTRLLRELALLYEGLPLHRTRSDAEGKALERFARAGLPVPDSNVTVGGFEADLVDHQRKLIVEIDGPQFHLFPDEDARRTAAWEAHGYRVVRRPSAAPYR
ncbi:MAG: DUF559 domain-containing protein [Solirubrobacteraceae bacterium]